MFNQQDYNQIGTKGIDIHVIHKQIDHFITGFPFIRLVRPAIAGDGLLKFDDEQQQFYLKYFENVLPALKVIKFVPASGAASRMFKHLFEFREQYSPGETGMSLFLKDQRFNSVFYFVNHIEEIVAINFMFAVCL